MALQFSYCILLFHLLIFICSHARDVIADEELENKKFFDAYSLKMSKINMEKFSRQKFHPKRNISEIIKNNSLEIYYKFLNEIQGKIPAWRSPEGSSSFITLCENFVLDYIHEASYLGLFTINSLYLGKTMPIYFPFEDNYYLTFPPFMPREIPHYYSTNKNPYWKICEIKHSHDQAEAQTKFCAKSLESLLDYIKTVFRSEGGFKVVETTHYPSLSTALLQDYIILETPQEIKGPNKLLCHPMYHSFYCHYDDEGVKVLKVLLGGENGDQVEAIGVCHMNTSMMSPNHIAFRLLPIKPGSPFCHFLPAGHLVWVQSPTIINMSSN